MIPVVEFPEVVEHYASFFKDVFFAEAFIEFKRYIIGLIVSERKTVEGINRLLLVESRNQSLLNRLLTESRYTFRRDVQMNLPVSGCLIILFLRCESRVNCFCSIGRSIGRSLKENILSVILVFRSLK